MDNEAEDGYKLLYIGASIFSGNGVNNQQFYTEERVSDTFLNCFANFVQKQNYLHEQARGKKNCWVTHNI